MPFYIGREIRRRDVIRAVSDGSTAYWGGRSVFCRPPVIEDRYGWQLFDKRLHNPRRDVVRKGSHAEFQRYCRDNALYLDIPTNPKGSLSRFFQPKEETRMYFRKIFNEAADRHMDWVKFAKAYKKERDRIKAIKMGMWKRYHRLISPQGIDVLTGAEFEFAVASYYQRIGYSAEVTSASGDYGVDVIATRSEDRVAIQAKRYSGKVGVKAIQEVSAGARYYSADKAVVFTNSTFTKPAINLARKTGVQLIAGDEARKLLESKKPQSIPEFEERAFDSMYVEIYDALKKAGKL